MLEINRINGVKNAFLMTTNPLVKKWYVCFKYKNSLNEVKVYKKTYQLNQKPYVINGKVNNKEKVTKSRLNLARELVKALQEKLDTTEFDIDRGNFVADAKDLLFTKYLNDFIDWKTNKITASSLKTYQSVINEIIQYLEKTKQHNVSLKNVDIYLLEEIINEKQKLSNSRANYYLTVLSNFYKKYLIKYLNIISNDENVANRLERFKEDDTEKHALFDDINKVFEILTKHKFYLGFMAKVIHYTLHRMDTITKLQFKDFDLANGIINIPSTKIKTSKKLTIRISKHIIEDIKEFVDTNKPQPDDYWFGYNDTMKNIKNQDTYNIQMFGKHKLPSYTISHHYDEFKKLKTTDKKIFTEKHTLYGMKANGYKYYKNGGDGKKFILSDEQIIKITGHSNTDILKKYSRQYEAIISPELWDSI